MYRHQVSPLASLKMEKGVFDDSNSMGRLHCHMDTTCARFIHKCTSKKEQIVPVLYKGCWGRKPETNLKIDQCNKIHVLPVVYALIQAKEYLDVKVSSWTKLSQKKPHMPPTVKKFIIQQFNHFTTWYKRLIKTWLLIYFYSASAPIRPHMFTDRLTDTQRIQHDTPGWTAHAISTEVSMFDTFFLIKNTFILGSGLNCSSRTLHSLITSVRHLWTVSQSNMASKTKPLSHLCIELQMNGEVSSYTKVRQALTSLFYLFICVIFVFSPSLT